MKTRKLLVAALAAVLMSSAAQAATKATPPPGLCFTAQATNSTVSLTFDGSGWTLPSVEYSTDAGKIWKPFAIGTDSVTLAKVGAKVYFRGNNPAGFSQGYDNRVRFALSGKIAASGNVMSLIDPTCKSKVIPSEYCFAWLFYACAALTTPPTLPATTLTEGCYAEMFCYCTSLTKAPALPAMTLTDYCYSFMFYGCNSLKAAPALPATTLAKECYYGMFCCCSSLTTAPAVLPAMTLTDYCYYKMFCACESLKAAPELPATTLARQCYCEMFYGCKSLKAAPAVLPAMTLADDCYNSMFEYCYSLTSVKMMATVEEGSQFYACNWLDHAAYVYGRGIFIKNASTPLDCFYRGDDGIPKGWTVIDSDAVGQYRKLTLPDLGIEPPKAGTVYSVKAYGLPSGLKLKYNAAKKDKKGRVVVKAKTDWWIEGVPTAVTDANQCPAYLAVTVGKTTTWYDLDLNGVLRVSPLPVVDMGALTVGNNLVATSWLPGLGAGGWSVSGLPKGLSYTAKTVYADKKKTKVKYEPDTIYGKCSAAGLYTVTAKRKVGSYYEFLKYRILVEPAGEFTTRDLTAYVALSPTITNKNLKAVSGLPAGVTFNAKKYIVSGKPTKAGTFAVTFTPKTGAKWTEMWIVAANEDGPELGFNTTGETKMEVAQGQKGTANELAFAADGTVTASGLPKGMKLVKKTDPETGVVSYALAGTPTTTGTYFVTVKAVKNGQTVTQRVAVTVKANPMAGTYYGYSVTMDGNYRYRTASLSIAASGKAMVKYTEGSKTYTLATAAGEFKSNGKGATYSFVQKANVKKKIPARTVIAAIVITDAGAQGGEWGVCTGATEDTMFLFGGFYKALSAATVNALRTDPETGFAPKATYVLANEADSAEVIYATYAYSSSTGKFTVKGKLPHGKAFSATVPAMGVGEKEGLMLAPISAADADGTRYLLMLTPGRDGSVYVDGFGSTKFDSYRYDFGTGYGTLPTTFKAAIANKVINFMPVVVTYPKKGDPAKNEKEVFCIRANGSKYFQVSFDEGQTWGAKTAYAYDKARGLITLSFTKGKTKYALDLLYAQPEFLCGQMKRQSNPVYNKKTKKTTYTTECGKAITSLAL